MQRNINMSFNLRRRTLIFHSEWVDMALGFDDEGDQRDVLLSLVEYGLTGIRPDHISPQIDAVLDHAQEKIERDYKRFVEYIKSQRLQRGEFKRRDLT